MGQSGGTTAVVTGAASGIGLAITAALAQAGTRVFPIDVDEERLAELASRDPNIAKGFAADVSDEAQMAAAFNELDHAFGELTICVANAGISRRAAFAETDFLAWRSVIAVNLDGVYLTVANALPRMRGAASIVLIGSTNGIVGHPLYAAYNASKAGVIALAKTLALELAPRIQVNAICPGYVLTPMQRSEYTPEMLSAVNRKIPSGRHASPEEVASLLLFLVSDAGRYITGQAIVIDGGETAGGLASR
jgi:meso-butanediol dehydrogenase/(S,S)-butanediol dehydrogenase/diacetyl reductase